jgi:outer membrane protein TolC
MLSELRTRGSRLAGVPVLLLLLAGPGTMAHADSGPGDAPASVPALSLSAAVRQALESDLDLLSQRQALAADFEQIGLTRSVLLPQIDTGVQAQLLDDDRADSSRGNNKQESVQFQAGLKQLVYDENSWADFQIQKHVYTGQVQQLESFRLSVVQDAANAFLDLDRSQRLLDIQVKNRELTRANRETSQARIAAGWSSEQEVLRWDVELASNDGNVRGAQVQVLQSRFSLNQVRNLSPETGVSPVPATIAEYGFAYARDPIAEALRDPEQDRRLRDFASRVGISRSPELAAIDASIAAADRQLVARRRAFWVPTVSVGVGVDHLINDTAGDQFNQTEWGVKGTLSFPLLEGGAKFSGLTQSRESLASLRSERSAAALSLEQAIRGAFAQASGAFETVGFAERASAAARKNYELVDASYVLGVSSILDLLDAQAQLLDAEIALTNSLYGFLQDLVAAERAISFYAFLEAPGDVDGLLDQLSQELGLSP